MKHIKKFESKYTVLKHYKKVDGKFVNTMKDTVEEPQRDSSMVNADEVRRIALENERREYERKRLEEQRLRDIEKKRIDDKAKELKTEFDLVFIDFIERGISTNIRYFNDYERYTYGFDIKYPINSNIDISAKTFKKISDDILDAESYIKYLKTKHDMIGYTQFSNNVVYNLTIYINIYDVK